MVQALVLLLLLVPVVASAQTPPACTLTANPSTVTGSGTVTLSWTTQNALTCVASGSWSGPKDCAGGSQVFEDVNFTRTFALKVTSATGRLAFSWTKPLQNEDGTPVNVTSYRLFIAATAAGVPSAVPIVLPASPLTYQTFVTPGQRVGGIMAVSDGNVPSRMSNLVTKNVVAQSDTCSATVTVTTRPKAPVLSRLFDTLFAR